jgi:hypothetical protein
MCSTSLAERKPVKPEGLMKDSIKRVFGYRNSCQTLILKMKMTGRKERQINYTSQYQNAIQTF